MLSTKPTRGCNYMNFPAVVLSVSKIDQGISINAMDEMNFK